MEKKSIMFLLPLNNVVLANMFTDFIECILELQKAGHTVSVGYANDTQVHQARSKLTDKLAKAVIVDKIPVDYVIWIDSDQCLFDHNTIFKLIENFENGKAFDILSAAYLSRNYPPGLPSLVGMKKEDDGLYSFIKKIDWGLILPVDVIGFGMCIMRPELLIKLNKQYGNRLFMPEYFDEENIFGEDVVFCKYAQAEGYTIGIDTRIHIGHGYATVNKDIYNGMRCYYDERAKRTFI
jgi:hypothetical protein